MAPLHGWGPRGQRLDARVPHGHWKTLTFIGALRHDRIDAPWVIDGPINGDIFTTYVKEVLAPTLSKGDIVILDNLGSHKGKAAVQSARPAGCWPRKPVMRTPYRFQSLLGRSHWDAEALRDVVRDYAIEALGDADGVLVVDETGFVKKGEHSVGVARQYSGTAGRIENAQVGVFLCYASRHGAALIDRRLYLPEVWTKDEKRRAKASVPSDLAFSSKLVIAREMISAVLDAGISCRFVLADALYGSDLGLRRMLEEHSQAYVLATRSNYTLRFLVRCPATFETDPLAT